MMTTRSPAALVDFLRQSLAVGPLPVNELEIKARAAGLLRQPQQLQHTKGFKAAKKLLGIRSIRTGFGKAGVWAWGLLPQPPSPSADPPPPPHPEALIKEAPGPNVPSAGGRPALDLRGRCIPTEWNDGIASLDHHRALKDVPPHRWRVFVDDCQGFLLAKEQWVERAAMFDWDALALFGCRAVRPLEHLASAGLLWTINGGKLNELHRDWAVIERATDRSRQVHHRRRQNPANVTLPWTLAKPLP